MAGPHARKIRGACARRAPRHPAFRLRPSWHLPGQGKSHPLRGGFLLSTPGTGGGSISAGFLPRETCSGTRWRRAGAIRRIGDRRPRALASRRGPLSALQQQLRALLRVVSAGRAAKLSGRKADALAPEAVRRPFDRGARSDRHGHWSGLRVQSRAAALPRSGAGRRRPVSCAREPLCAGLHQPFSLMATPSAERLKRRPSAVDNSLMTTPF